MEDLDCITEWMVNNPIENNDSLNVETIESLKPLDNLSSGDVKLSILLLLTLGKHHYLFLFLFLGFLMNQR
jgi:hypothetical protein